jgi:hypothetical protein
MRLRNHWQVSPRHYIEFDAILRRGNPADEILEEAHTWRPLGKVTQQCAKLRTQFP